MAEKTGNVRAVFERAVEIESADARHAYIAGACAGDVELCREVEKLMCADARAGDFLDSPALAQLVRDPEALKELCKAIERSSDPQAGAPDSSDRADNGERDSKAIDASFLQPPTQPGTLGRLPPYYTVHEVLGSGTFGIVCKAFHEKLHQFRSRERSAIMFAASRLRSLLRRVPPFFSALLRKQRRPLASTRRRPGRKLLGEWLEERITPSFASPTWVEQGPGPITNGQVEGLAAQNNPVAGAVEAIAAHPTNPDIVVIATVNGGIWTTANATASSPTWTPRTDAFSSLSIGAIAYSPVDSNILYAGTGSFSSGAGAGGPAIGVLKSTDGGASWAQVGGTTLNGFRIRSIVPTTLSGGQVVLVGAQNTGGLFRSTNGGTTFTQISGTGGLPGGLSCFSIVADGADPNTFYASVGVNSASQGVFRSTNGGINWTNVSAGISGLAGAAVRIELAAHYDSSDASKALYCAVIAQADGGLSGVFRSTNGGTNWTAMDVVQTNEPGGAVGLHPSNKPIGAPEPEDPGGQGSTHFSILTDRSSEFVVYVGGDRQPGPGEGGIVSFPNSIGAANYSGRHFRGDASQSAGNQWYAINATGLAGNPNDGASGTSPHADSRDMVFDANGNILEADDGGIYRLTNPNSVSRAWMSVNGTLRATEFYSVAYDSLNNVINGGTQDVGSARQPNAGSLTWNELQQGDGGVVQVDVISSPGNAIHYNSAQSLQSFIRRTYNSSNTLTNTTTVTTTVVGSGGQTLRQYDTANIQFIQPWVLNAVDATRMLIGTTDLYESSDRGANLTDLNYGGSGAIGAMAYGGRLSGVDNPNVIYAAGGSSLRLRTTAGGAFSLLSAYTGSTVRDIAIDPDNWQRAYVLDALGRVFRTVNAGTSWTNITSTLSSLATDLRTIDLYSPTTVADDEAIFVGGLGGVFATDNAHLGASTTWIEFGSGLPNYLVRDLRYDKTDDVLLAGGFGRGAWTVPNLSASVSTLTVTLSLTGSPLAENAGVATATATLSAVSGQDVTVNLGFTGTATSTSDYTRSGTSIVIAAGATTGSITLTGVDDAFDEANATVIVDIMTVSNGTESGTQQVTATITDDDPTPTVTLSLAGSPLAENGGVATVTATLSAPSGQDVTVDLGFTGTATNGSDYTRSGTSIVIAAGATTGSITLTGVDDALDEANETVIIDITTVTNGTESGTQQMTATITDDDPTPTVTLALAGSPLAEYGGVATVTVTLSTVSGQDVTVNLGFSGTATNLSDYTRSSTSIVIAAGATTGSITLTGVNDAMDEADDTIIVDITTVNNGTESGTQRVTATIPDDDVPNRALVGAFDNGTFTLQSGDMFFSFGAANDVPITGDWNGDGKVDVGVWRPSTARFYLDSNGNDRFDVATDAQFSFGITNDLPVTGDWDGDGRADVGIWRPSQARFYLDSNGNRLFDAGADVQFQFGTSNDLPLTGDWDGDGRTDTGVRRQGTANFYLDSNGNRIDEPGVDALFSFGAATDLPLSGDWNGDGRADIGVWRPSTARFYLDSNHNGRFDAGVDPSFVFGGSGDKPVTGDWNGDGVTDVGVASAAQFALDADADQRLGSNASFVFLPFQAGDVPLVGDWNGDGLDEVGIWRSGVFYLDLDGDRVYTAGVDGAYSFGAVNDVPVTGDWNGDGITDIGVWRPSAARFYLDSNGNHAYNAGADAQFTFGGVTTDLPLTGDWNGDGITDIGVWRPSASRFYLDSNGNHAYNAGDDAQFAYGTTTDLPVSGDWNGDGVAEVGVWRPSTMTFYLDSNGNKTLDGSDLHPVFGSASSKPLSGRWYRLP